MWGAAGENVFTVYGQMTKNLRSQIDEVETVALEEDVCDDFENL